MTQKPPVTHKTLAEEALAQGQPTAWFEKLYAAAAVGEAVIPWADRAVNPYFAALRTEVPPKADARVLVVGCGLGDDAEWLAAQGYAVTAFDIAPTAVAHCKERFPATKVHYTVGDLLNPPADWIGAFDLVAEAYTLQALPASVRGVAAENVTRFVAPGGLLYVVARSRPDDSTVDGPPWPLTPGEIKSLARDGLTLVHWVDCGLDETPPVARVRAAFRKA